jgi:hypothetical protein
VIHPAVATARKDRNVVVHSPSHMLHCMCRNFAIRPWSRSRLINLVDPVHCENEIVLSRARTRSSLGLVLEAFRSGCVLRIVDRHALIELA